MSEAPLPDSAEAAPVTPRPYGIQVSPGAASLHWATSPQTGTAGRCRISFVARERHGSTPSRRSFHGVRDAANEPQVFRAAVDEHAHIQANAFLWSVAHCR